MQDFCEFQVIINRVDIFAKKILQSRAECYDKMNMVIKLNDHRIIYRNSCKRQRKETDNLKKICTIGIVLCIVVGICSYHVLSNYFTKNESVNITTDEKEIDRAFEQLKSSINAGMGLDQLLDEFEAICQIPACDSMILYEAGRYAFHLEPLFHIILVRQYHDVDGNKNHIYVDIQYEPDIENTDFRECVWSDEIQEDIFDYIKSSEAYQYASQSHYSKVNAYIN